MTTRYCAYTQYRYNEELDRLTVFYGHLAVGRLYVCWCGASLLGHMTYLSVISARLITYMFYGFRLNKKSASSGQVPNFRPEYDTNFQLNLSLSVICTRAPAN